VKSGDSRTNISQFTSKVKLCTNFLIFIAKLNIYKKTLSIVFYFLYNDSVVLFVCCVVVFNIKQDTQRVRSPFKFIKSL